MAISAADASITGLEVSIAPTEIANVVFIIFIKLSCLFIETVF